MKIRQRNCHLVIGILLLGQLAWVASVSAAPPLSTQRAEAISRCQNAVRAFMEVSGTTGISVAISRNGQPLWSEGFGFADLENRVAVSKESRFRLGSVSKMLTIAAVAKLYQDGKLDLDAPIQRYVPTFPDKGNPITARQLAGHLSGIRHYQGKDFNPNIDFQHFNTVADSLKIFQDDPLVAAPGTRYSYSTFGYTLLSQVVESAAKQSFLSYLQENVLQPLGLTHTTPDYTDRLILGRTRFYDRDNQGQIINAAYVDSSYKWAGGGLLSTAEDLVRFGTAHLQAGFFTQETLTQLFTSQKTADGKATDVGLGWRIGQDARGRRIFHHAGSIAGGRTVLVIYPDAGVVIAMLSNLSTSPLAIERTAQTLADQFLDAESSKAKSPAKINPVGRYNFTIDAGEQSDSGDLEIVKAETGYVGTMTAPKAFADFARRTRQPAIERLKIASLVIQGNQAQMQLATSVGIFPLTVLFEGNEISGRINAQLGPAVAEIAFRGKRQ